MWCRLAALLLAATTLGISTGLSIDDRQSNIEKDFKSLEKDCSKCRSPREALMLIAEFKHKHRNSASGPFGKSANQLAEQWQDRLDQGLVRLGTKWCTVEEQQAAAHDSQELVETAVGLIRVNDIDGARVNLEKASSVDPNSYLADYLLGLHFALHNDAEEARGHFKKVLTRSPRNTGAMNNLAVSEVKNGNVSAAIGHWELAAELAPTNKEIMHNVGRVVSENGKQRIKASKNVIARYRKLYGQSTATTTSSTDSSNSVWLLTPAVASSGTRSKESAPVDVANLVNIGGQGSGFFVGTNLILTNRHVVENETYGMADGIQVSIPAGEHKTQKERAEVVAVSDEHDLALLRCQTLNLPPLSLSARSPKLGEEAMALGYPNTAILGLGLKSTRGSISAVPEESRNTLLYDVTINPGNSGGPLLDAAGRVIAINTFFFRLDQGISGGVPATSASAFLQQSLPDILASDGDGNTLAWPEIASSAAASIVYVEVLFKDAAPVFAEIAGNDRMQDSCFIDDSCLICMGYGSVPCQNRSCRGGRLSVPYTETQRVGFGRYARDVPLRKFRYEDCPICVGKKVNCPACNGTGKGGN